MPLYVFLCGTFNIDLTEALPTVAPLPVFSSMSPMRKQRILLFHTRQPVPPRGLFLSQNRREQLDKVLQVREGIYHRQHMRTMPSCST
ncbi:hypothetical protein FB451DRAFT_413234 [Mycena latifolia]|nr:hypothetical protein FB451DRAFT_413234 [Mycena latifolia]